MVISAAFQSCCLAGGLRFYLYWLLPQLMDNVRLLISASASSPEVVAPKVSRSAASGMIMVMMQIKNNESRNDGSSLLLFWFGVTVSVLAVLFSPVWGLHERRVSWAVPHPKWVSQKTTMKQNHKPYHLFLFLPVHKQPDHLSSRMKQRGKLRWTCMKLTLFLMGSGWNCE